MVEGTVGGRTRRASDVRSRYPHRLVCPDEIKWKGDGEEPSQDALIEWFKVNHPAQASEAESKIRRRELEIERQQAQDRPAMRG